MKLVLLDLDGTLVDSAPDIADAVDRALADHGWPPRGEAAVRGYIGEGAARLVHRAITGEPDGVADTKAFERVHGSFLAHYESRVYRRSRLYPQVAETLSGLTAAGWTLGCVTNKPGRFTEAVLEAAGIRPHFELVLSGDSLQRRKPDPAPILHACDTLGTSPARTAMVGDSPTDLAAAKEAGVVAVCVSYGYAGGADLEALGADATIDAFGDLPDALGRLLG